MFRNPIPRIVGRSTVLALAASAIAATPALAKSATVQSLDTTVGSALNTVVDTSSCVAPALQPAAPRPGRRERVHARARRVR